MSKNVKVKATGVFVAYHDHLYKVEDFKKDAGGMWLKLEGLAFMVRDSWVTIIGE